MITFKPIDLDRDYPTICGWWAGHGSPSVHRIALPRGWMAVGSDGVEIAACFLYAVEGKIAVIEFMTTNPARSFGRELAVAVKGLYAHLEEQAAELGCVAVISFVAIGSGEERIMERTGYSCTPDSKPHRMFAKPLQPKEVTCPSR